MLEEEHGSLAAVAVKVPCSTAALYTYVCTAVKRYCYRVSLSLESIVLS